MVVQCPRWLLWIRFYLEVEPLVLAKMFLKYLIRFSDGNFGACFFRFNGVIECDNNGGRGNVLTSSSASRAFYSWNWFAFCCCRLLVRCNSLGIVCMTLVRCNVRLRFNDWLVKRSIIAELSHTIRTELANSIKCWYRKNHLFCKGNESGVSSINS